MTIPCQQDTMEESVTEYFTLYKYIWTKNKGIEFSMSQNGLNAMIGKYITTLSRREIVIHDNHVLREIGGIHFTNKWTVCLISQQWNHQNLLFGAQGMGTSLVE